MQAFYATIPVVVWQYADSCVSLWRNRENAAQSRTFDATLQDLEDLDRRLDANIDGLRTTGEIGFEAVAENSEQQMPGAFFATAILLLEARRENENFVDRLNRFLQSIEKPLQGWRPLSVALDWIDPALIPLLEKDLADVGEMGAALSLAASARCGACQLVRVTRALESGSPLLIEAACEAAQITHERALLRPMEVLLESREERIVDAAAFAALAQGSSLAHETMAQVAAGPESVRAERAAVRLFRAVAPRQTLALHRTLFGQTACRASVEAAGAAGTPELVPFLLRAMQTPELARLAASALCGAMAIALKRERLEGTAPEDHVAGPTADPADVNTEIDLDEGKVWPDASLVQAWWQVHGSKFERNTRYLAGTPASDAFLWDFLQRGSQSVRAAAAELLAFGGRPLFDVRAPAFRQRQRLATGGVWR